jgi:Holliday junction resolvase RusA-like endonuclease
VTVVVEAQGIQFTVYGPPVPQGSKRVFHGNVVDMQSERLRTWRQDVAGTAREAMEGASPYTEPVDVRLMFWLSRPQGHFGTGRNSEKLKASAPIAPGRQPDLDKLCRAILDALTGIVFKDDGQVVGLTASKLWAVDSFYPGMTCSVLELAPDL